MSIARKELKGHDFKGVTGGRKLAPVHPWRWVSAHFYPGFIDRFISSG